MQVLVLVVQNTSSFADLGVATSGVTFFRTIGSSFGAAVFAWTQLPPEMRTEIPRSAIGWIGIGVLFFGFITPLVVNALQPKLQRPQLPDA